MIRTTHCPQLPCASSVACRRELECFARRGRRARRRQLGAARRPTFMNVLRYESWTTNGVRYYWDRLTEGNYGEMEDSQLLKKAVSKTFSGHFGTAASAASCSNAVKWFLTEFLQLNLSNSDRTTPTNTSTRSPRFRAFLLRDSGSAAARCQRRSSRCLR